MDSPAVSSHFPPDTWLTGMNRGPVSGARTRQLVTAMVLVT